MPFKNYTASTVLNYSPRKARLVIDAIRGKNLTEALRILQFMNKPKAKKIYNLLISAATNLNLTDNDYESQKIGSIVAEEAQKYYRAMPRARGSAARIRRRYSRIKVLLAGV